MFINSGPRNVAIKAKVLQLKIGNLTREEVDQMSGKKGDLVKHLSEFEVSLGHLENAQKQAMLGLFHSDIVELIAYYEAAIQLMSAHSSSNRLNR